MPKRKTGISKRRGEEGERFNAIASLLKKVFNKGMPSRLKCSEVIQRIEVLSQGKIGRPALVRIGPQDHFGFDHEPNTILILEDTAKRLLVSEIPEGIALTPCKRLEFNDDEYEDFDLPLTPSRFDGIAPFKVYNSGHGRATLVLSWHCTKAFWNSEYSYKWKLQRAKAAVLSRRKQLRGIRFHRFFDHGYLAGVEFEVEIAAFGLESVFQIASEMSKSVHSIVEEVLSSRLKGPVNETGFVRETFIPLLKNLGFKNIAFHHGPREFGRDVIFSRQTEFGCWEYWAAQVKVGDVSGKSNSFVDLIVSQTQDAFQIPLLDLQTKTKVWISKFVVAITGSYTENAIEKICEKIESHSQRNNIVFLDGEKIQELIYRSRRP